MPSVTITTPTDARVVQGFQVGSDVTDAAFTAVLSAVGTLSLEGDELDNPMPLKVKVWSDGATFTERALDVHQVVALAREATTVTTPRGTRTVDGLLSWRIEGQDSSVVVTLEFAALGGYS